MTDDEKLPYTELARKDKLRFDAATKKVLSGHKVSKYGNPVKVQLPPLIIEGVVIKRPKPAFVRYKSMRLAENKNRPAGEQLKNLDMWKLIGEEWSKMTDTEKKPWYDQFNVD